MNRIYLLCMVCIAVFAVTFSGCKKQEDADAALSETSINIEAITEDNALEEADKVLQEIDKL